MGVDWSVTNYAEHLATAMRRQYGLKPEDMIWIEHYPESQGHRKAAKESDHFTLMAARKTATGEPRFLQKALGGRASLRICFCAEHVSFALPSSRQ
jgi:hypothetical protein